jgi:hypothetical protein
MLYDSKTILTRRDILRMEKGKSVFHRETDGRERKARVSQPLAKPEEAA